MLAGSRTEVVVRASRLPQAEPHPLVRLVRYTQRPRISQAWVNSLRLRRGVKA